jgi:hypothetical protein
MAITPKLQPQVLRHSLDRELGQEQIRQGKKPVKARDRAASVSGLNGWTRDNHRRDYGFSDAQLRIVACALDGYRRLKAHPGMTAL